MESNKHILDIVEKFRKNAGANPDEVIEELDHWYNCKNEIDDGASGREHSLYKNIKELVKGLLSKTEK